MRSLVVRRAALAVLAVVVGVLVALGAAFALDPVRRNGRVERGVTLAGRDVGGLTPAQLRVRVGALARDLTAADVRVDAPGGGFTADGESFGLRLDRPATVREVLDMGREGSLPGQLVGWLRSFVGSRPADVVVAADEAAVYALVAERDPGPRTEPQEPSIAYRDGELQVVAGDDGRGIDPRDVLDALPGAVARGIPVVVEVDRGDVAPRFDEEDVEPLLERAEELADRPLQVRAGETDGTVPRRTVARWLTTETTADGPRLALRRDRVLDDLEKLLDDAGRAPVDASFTVQDGAVRIVPGRDGTRCCAPGAVDEISDALLGGATGRVRLPLAPRPPRRTVEAAERLGIVEPIASFTSRHKAGEPRVRNIHRIADLLRGHVIEPGGTLSVNRAVGRRTKAKGFVAAPVIEDGMFSEDVGGGISQFATTLFNAAFFGGLEFGEYQSHSIYISRYPYGREATLSFPHPDLEIENPSPYGVLVWPTYTETSITVTLYSTKWATGEQTGQSTAKRGNCTRVTTQRTRTWVDGRTEVDRVYATYRPEEGVNC